MCPICISANTHTLLSVSATPQVLDLETGRHVGPHTEGEVVVRGPQVMKGYFQNPGATAETVRDGWLFTGKETGSLHNVAYLMVSVYVMLCYLVLSVQ